MDDLAVGRLIMLARQRKHWRQVDLARAAGVSQQLVAVVEAGRLAQLSVRTLRRIAEPLEMRVLVNALWRGGEADRLRDRDHAMLVEHVTVLLQARRWEAVIEYTFSHYGERGSIDLVAWHPSARALLVIEVKTRIYDVQALLSAMDRKARLAGKLLAVERGWAPRAVGRVLVVPALSANRALVMRHTALFNATLPARSRDVRTWLRRPAGAISGVWFLSSTRQVGGIQVAVGRRRVRVRGGTPMTTREPRATTLAGE
jgi:transcriptional regulator with XRE-family HTH domain